MHDLSGYWRLGALGDPSEGRCLVSCRPKTLEKGLSMEVRSLSWSHTAQV